MSRPTATTDAGVATSQELLRAALHRSARRNTWVARRRLAWRWCLWALGWSARWLSGPLLLAVAGWWWLTQTGQAPLPAAASPAPATVAPAPSMAALPAPSAPASAVAEQESSTLQLRLDDEAPGSPRSARKTQLPSRGPSPAGPAVPQE